MEDLLCHPERANSLSAKSKMFTILLQSVDIHVCIYIYNYILVPVKKGYVRSNLQQILLDILYSTF